MVLPPYKGAVFRGAFGNAFRHLVCVAPKADCVACLLRSQCLYVAFFEPPPPSDYPDAAKFSSAPAPYVLNPPLTNRQAFHPGDLLDFEMVLIGPAIEALPYFIYTFTELGRMGLGSKRGKYDLVKVELLRGEEALQIYDDGTQMLEAHLPPGASTISQQPENGLTSLTFHFLTPVRLKVKGDLVTHLTFPLFFERLAQRLTLLTVFYSPSVHPPDFSPLVTAAQDINVVADDLRWYDWERYSSRHRDVMKFGGLRGRITFSGELAPFMPWLRLGGGVNVGQQTTFGLGKFKLDL